MCVFFYISDQFSCHCNSWILLSAHILTEYLLPDRQKEGCGQPEKKQCTKGVNQGVFSFKKEGKISLSLEGKENLTANTEKAVHVNSTSKGSCR